MYAERQYNGDSTRIVSYVLSDSWFRDSVGRSPLHHIGASLFGQGDPEWSQGPVLDPPPQLRAVLGDESEAEEGQWNQSTPARSELAPTGPAFWRVGLEAKHIHSPHEIVNWWRLGRCHGGVPAFPKTSQRGRSWRGGPNRGWRRHPVVNPTGPWAGRWLSSLDVLGSPSESDRRQPASEALAASQQCHRMGKSRTRQLATGRNRNERSRRRL